MNPFENTQTAQKILAELETGLITLREDRDTAYWELGRTYDGTEMVQGQTGTRTQ